jgi:spore coat protein CotH
MANTWVKDMISSKNINKICAVITALAVIITVLFMNGASLGVQAIDSVSFDYEDTLFDDSYVHTIDISIDDWDGFIENATSEVYSNADVTIDGETVKNVGIRAKGNTSLSTVSQLDSERYSLKIEFDAYNANGNYNGLDKLCLNNLIQDYSMMKDYIAYKLMYEFGVASPLVSYCYVTINGEDWGLYLAVEGVEDSFLERNYGTNYGDLYKPDTLSMGGGRGNGGGFDMKDIDFDKLGMDNPFENNGNMPSFNEGGTDTERPDSKDRDSNSQKPDFKDMDFGSQMPDFGSQRPDSESGDLPDGQRDMKGGFGPGGGFGMGSDEAKLKYIDDDTDSYSTLWESAKTKVNKADMKRLISSLKSLSEGIEEADTDKIDSAADNEAVMRYMVVHNFVVNGDSYTGSMIHNYYLYEEDGQMSMIPWDYNLAFGTFQASEATKAVNDPIDTPLSISQNDTDRPMFSWIISDDEYIQEYHEYYEEFIEQFYNSGYLSDLIEDTYEMIKDYVEKDPTKFCTVEEFDKAVDTMQQFVSLRCESIKGQLDGSIPSTDSGQEQDSDSLIDASSLKLSDMGSMGGGMGFGYRPGSDRESSEDKNSEDQSDEAQTDHSSKRSGFGTPPSDMGGEGGFPSDNGQTDRTPPDFGGETSDFGSMPMNMDSQGFATSGVNYIYIAVSLVGILAAIVFAKRYGS